MSARPLVAVAVGTALLTAALGFAAAGDPTLTPTLGTLALAAAAAGGWLVHRLARPRPDGGAGQAPAGDTADLRAIVGHLADAVAATDRRGHIIAWNPAMERLCGRPAAAALGRPLEAVLPFARVLVLLRQAQQQGGECHEELQIDVTTDDGPQSRAVAARAAALAGGGLLVLRDLSRLRRLEEHRRDFVANVSHELKTPLSAIKGYCETLLDDAAMPESTRLRFLGRIQQQTERLTHLVRDLLALSRLDEDPVLQEPPPPCDWAAVARECWRDLEPLGQKKQQELVWTPAPGPLLVRAERETLVQITMNLLENAIKYTGERGRIELRLAPIDDQVELAVADTGIGLTPADQERVFERFYRVDKARSADVEGTGLGLAIVKNSVLRAGGRLGVTSTPGQGSTFWVRLPGVAREPARPLVQE